MSTELTHTEHAAAILQARMSWPEAERCAASLDEAGWTSLTEPRAVAILTKHLPPSRAESAAHDLVAEGLILAACQTEEG